ncbi:MAG: hypothetical protein AB1499_02885 [Nitrospirota bacterium]
MNIKGFIISACTAAVILLTASISSALPGAIVVYNETDLGGSWRYDYTIYNISTEGEALHEVLFYFPGDVMVTGTSLPSGWHGIPWTGTYTISYLNAYSTDFTYDTVAWDSLNGFSFTVDSRAGDILYEAYFSGDKRISGSTLFCLFSFYRDADGDGYGNPEDSVQDCFAPEGYVADGTDCNDGLASINPSTLWYQDYDEDGYGDAAIYFQQCTEPPGPTRYVFNKLDYNDNNPTIGPAVKLTGTAIAYYLSLQDAYDHASEGDTIRAAAVIITENLNINQSKTVTINGGYNGTFTSQTGQTTLHGNLSVTDGKLTIQEVIIE